MHDIIINIIKSLFKECRNLNFTSLNNYTTFRDFIYTHRYIYNQPFVDEDFIYRIYINISINHESISAVHAINYNVVEIDKYKIIPICKFSINDNILLTKESEHIKYVSNMVIDAINKDLNSSDYQYIEQIHDYC